MKKRLATLILFLASIASPTLLFAEETGATPGKTLHIGDWLMQIAAYCGDLWGYLMY
jgi:hypothetical protein